MFLVDDGDRFTYTGLGAIYIHTHIYGLGISVVTNHGLERDFFEPSFVPPLRRNPVAGLQSEKKR